MYRLSPAEGTEHGGGRGTGAQDKNPPPATTGRLVSVEGKMVNLLVRWLNAGKKDNGGHAVGSPKVDLKTIPSLSLSISLSFFIFRISISKAEVKSCLVAAKQHSLYHWTGVPLLEGFHHASIASGFYRTFSLSVPVMVSPPHFVARWTVGQRWNFI